MSSSTRLRPQIDASGGASRSSNVPYAGREVRGRVRLTIHAGEPVVLNVLTRSFPTNLTAMIFSYQVKPSFTVENEKAISAPPSVSFDKPAAPAAAASR